MNQLSDVQLEWVATFLSVPKNDLVAGMGGEAASSKAAAGGAAAGAAAGAADGKLPSPMLPDCKPVHGKVPGPANHLLCAEHKHVVDVEAKTIIAHSLEEYVKSHPAAGKGHSAHAEHGAQAEHGADASGGAHGKAAPAATGAAAAGGAAAPADGAAKPEPKPTDVPRTKIPVFTGSAKEVFAQECALLDTFRPSKENPDLYTAVVDGKETTIAKAQAETILAQVSKQMQDSITSIAQSNHEIIKIYEQASAKGLEHIGSGVNKLVSLVKGDGWIHDPGSDLENLQGEWLAALSQGRNMIQVRQFSAAAGFIADGEIRGGQAEHLLKVFESKVQKNADTTLSVLKTVESTSKSIAKTIATAEFGKAGAAAIDATFAAADVTGEALAGNKVDWAGHFIDLGMDLLSDKYGDQAEAAVKGRVKGLVADKLKRLGKEKAEKLAEKIAEKVAKKAVSKGSDLLRDELHAAAKKEQNSKTATYDDLAKAAVDAIQKPTAATTQKFETEIENDPEFMAVMTGGPG